MKKLAIGLLLTSGFLMAAETSQPVQNPHIGYYQRIALRTQSPAVYTHHGKRTTNKHSNYRISENKTTITATIPWGK